RYGLGAWTFRTSWHCLRHSTNCYADHPRGGVAWQLRSSRSPWLANPDIFGSACTSDHDFGNPDSWYRRRVIGRRYEAMSFTSKVSLWKSAHIHYGEIRVASAADRLCPQKKSSATPTELVTQES